MPQKFSLQAQVPDAMAGLRLDQAAARLFPDFSRARLQDWIKDGRLLVDSRQARTRDKLLGGEALCLEAEAEAQDDWQAEARALNILFEDSELLVLDKPAGLVVHPAAGNRSGTLLNALLHHCPALQTIPRAGIVHRLDKDTTGLMVVAKTLRSHQALVAQLAAREVRREYQAVAQGVLTAGGSVDAPLGRHPTQRKRMAVVQGPHAKRAVTHYRVLARFPGHTHLLLRLETGRTHQIRVHMAHIGHPLVGDPTYGGRLRLPPGASPALSACLRGFGRQALHAWRLGLHHPLSGEELAWESPPPEDLRTLLALLEAEA